MKLHEIIQKNDQLLNGTATFHGISFEDIAPYKKLLTAYYSNLWPRGNEPVFVATFVTNAICAGLIAPSCELSDVFDMLTNDIEDEDERNNEIELLSYQSHLLNS
jgi:hypothetical protein